MKKLLLLILQLVIISNSYGQMTVNVGEKVSNQLSDWSKYKMVTIQTNFSTPQIGKLHFRIYSNEDSPPLVLVCNEDK